ncbi:MAG: DUF1697 domain-containing protein [Planctomycetes bacterium]|nr:DUF1697 domain-containing protein [Planctomycetota bacterium]
MPTHIALLRAVNVGGTGKLPMAELRALAEQLEFENPRTYIASGNLVFESALAANKARAKLEAALAEHLGKPVGVVMRSAGELRALLEANPFPDAPPSRVLVSLLNDPLPADWESGVRNQKGELIVATKRELYVHYVDGQGASKLRIPAAEAATARNLNTLRALLEL